MTADPRQTEARARDAPRVCIVDRGTPETGRTPMREARALSGCGIDTHLICRRGAGTLARPAGARPHYCGRGSLDRRGAGANALFSLRAAVWLVALHFKYRFAMVQVDLASAWLVIPLAAARLAGVASVVHMMEPLAENRAGVYSKSRRGPVSVTVEWVGRLACRLAGRVVVGTRQMRDDMGRRGADIHKIVVVVDVPEEPLLAPVTGRGTLERLAERKKDERRRGVFRVITRGAGPHTMRGLVRALGIVSRRVPGVELHVMVGAADDRLPALAAEHEVGARVHTVAEAGGALQEILSADVALVPERADRYANQVIGPDIFEFAALEKPIVAARTTAIESYFSDEALVLYDPDDPEDLADRIHHVFANPEESRRRVEKMSELLETYRWTRERKKYLGVFSPLLPAAGAGMDAGPGGPA
ncbi:MAG: glycosyltransferase [Candidatus Krumholzibacteriia bacterium]